MICAALVLGLLLGLLGDLLDDRAGLAGGTRPRCACSSISFACSARHAGDLEQPLALLARARSSSCCSFGGDGLLARWRAWRSRSSRFFSLTDERVELAVEHVLALGEAQLVLLELAAGGFVLALELLLELELLLLGGQLDFLGLVVRLAAGVFADRVGLGAARASMLRAGEAG